MAKEYSYIRKTFTHAGKRYTVRGKTEREVNRKMDEKKIELREGEKTAGGKMPLSKWYRIAFETYKPNVSDRYRQDSIDRFRKNVIPELGSMPVERVTPLDLQKILNQQAGKSESYLRKFKQELFFVFECARKNGMIVKNPAADLVLPSGTKHKRRALTDEERRHLLAVIPTDPRFVFFELMLYCGCRPGEAAKVCYEDVTEIQGIPFLHIRGTKTANSDRFVPIPEELRAKLIQGHSRGPVALSGANKPHTRETYRNMVASLKRALNISMGAALYRNQLQEPLPLASDFVPYMLRHTYCTDLKKKGVDVRIAKDLMGHADIATTANIYDHNDAGSLILAAVQMGLCDKNGDKTSE